MGWGNDRQMLLTPFWPRRRSFGSPGLSGTGSDGIGRPRDFDYEYYTSSLLFLRRPLEPGYFSPEPCTRNSERTTHEDSGINDFWNTGTRTEYSNLSRERPRTSTQCRRNSFSPLLRRSGHQTIGDRRMPVAHGVRQTRSGH